MILGQFLHLKFLCSLRIYDKEVNLWIARNDDILLALEDKSFENLLKRVKEVATELIGMNKKPDVPVRIVVVDINEAIKNYRNW